MSTEAINDLVTGQTATGEQAFNDAVTALAESESKARATSLRFVIARARSLTKEREGLTPDQKGYDGDGKLVSETYSEGQNDARITLAKAISVYESAIQQAKESNNFDEAFKLSVHATCPPDYHWARFDTGLA